MGRILFVVPPLVGHVNPTVSVGRMLRERGHRVAWVGHPGKVRPLLGSEATLFELDERVDADVVEAVRNRAASTRGAAALKFLWEDFFVPLARSMLPGVEAAVARFGPDLLVVDQQALAGALVARRRSLRWATFATTSAGVVDPFATLPKVRGWLDALLGVLQQEAGLSPRVGGTVSPDRVIAFTTRALIGERVEILPQTALVGPALGGRPAGASFPWQWLQRDRAKVLISVGTVNGDAAGRFVATAIAAVREMDVQAVVVTGTDGHGFDPPDNVLVCSYVPQLRLMPHLDAVICHGGHNTVVESLAHGLPLVVAPIRDDQPIVAQQVVDAGAGLRVKFGRVGPEELRQSIERVLRDKLYAEAARKIAASFDAAGGAARAAEYLEGML